MSEEEDDAPIKIMGDRILWISGCAYPVAHEVWAHVNFLTALNSSFAGKLSTLVDELKLAKAALPKPVGGVRWTAERKEKLAQQAQRSPADRAAVMLICEISATELDGWIARFAQFGRDGLKTTKLQKVGPVT